MALEYAALVDSRALTSLSAGRDLPGTGVVLLAARVGSTRLIDNTVLGLDAPPPVAAT